MKYADFSEFYTNISVNKKNVEEVWKKFKERSQKEKWISLIIIAIVDLGTFLAIGSISIFIIIPILVLDFLIYIIVKLLVYATTKGNVPTDEYEEKMINELLGNFIDELDYIPRKQLPSNIYDEANFGGYYNIYYGDDYFEGKICNQNVVMGDIVVKEETERVNINGEKERHIKTIFEGLFGKINLEKSIETYLKITRNKEMVAKNQKLEMDSYEFEKIFNVYSENEIIGMQLLTADIQQDIIDLYNKYKIDFHIFIYRSRMYVLFSTGGMFDVFTTKKTPAEMLEKYFEIMKFIYKITEKIIKTIENTQI